MLDPVGFEGAGERLDSGSRGGSMRLRVSRNIDRSVLLTPICSSSEGVCLFEGEGFEGEG